MVIGEHTLDEKGNVVCKCGCKDKFKMTCHIDKVDKAITNYQCSNCGNVVTVETQREMF